MMKAGKLKNLIVFKNVQADSKGHEQRNINKTKILKKLENAI